MPNANRLILDERRYNVDVLRESVQRCLASLNTDQRTAFDALCEAVASGAGGVFFLEGFGGTGKTFLVNLVLAKIRADGGIALSTASSGIAATLLDGGTTAHSRFKIPIDTLIRHVIFLLKVISLNSYVKLNWYFGTRHRCSIDTHSRQSIVP